MIYAKTLGVIFSGRASRKEKPSDRSDMGIK